MQSDSNIPAWSQGFGANWPQNLNSLTHNDPDQTKTVTKIAQVMYGP